jgi:predicted phosphoribosyltransferase
MTLSSYSSKARPLFQDRLDAARQLSQKLLSYKNEDCVVVALPRGGVPIAYQVARILNASLFVLSVRKLGSPTQPELAIGAIASDGTIQFNVQLLQQMSIDPRELFDIVEAQSKNAAKRQQRYQPFQPEINFEDKTFIVVDDGLATGMTMQVSIAAIKKQQPQKVIAAVPVCAKETTRSIRQYADELICLHQPYELISVGLWYHDFAQVSDEEVIALLKSANKQEVSFH